MHKKNVFIKNLRKEKVKTRIICQFVLGILPCFILDGDFFGKVIL